jgi:type II secretory pathway component PulM
MKLVLSPSRQRWIALGLAAFVATVLVWVVVLPLWGRLVLHNEHLSMLRMQVSKLEALAVARPRLEGVLRAVSGNTSIQALTIGATQPSVGVAELQSMLNNIMAGAGAQVTRGQAIEGGAEAAGKVAVQLTLETDISSLVRALQAIGVARPLLTIESMSVSEPDGEFVGVGPQPVIANRLIVEIVVSARLRGM